MWDEGIEMARTAYALDEALESGDTGRIIELADLLSGQVKQEVSTRAEAEGWYEEYDRATSQEEIETVPEWLAAAADTGKANPYLRSFKQTLEDGLWRVREGVSGDVFSLTYGPMFPGVEPEFTVPLDMRGKDLNDPKAWIEAAKDAAASDTVFWSGGVRKDEPGWVAEEIKRFKEGALAELPQLVEVAMAAAPWLDFTEADVKVPEAAWAFETEDGHQCVAECHLTDDEDSPWGCAFYFSTYTYSSELRMWQEYDGGMFWGYKNADDPELEAEAIGACEYSCGDGDERRIDYGLLDTHGVWDGHGLPLTPDELGRAREGSALDLDAEVDELRDVSHGLDAHAAPLPDKSQGR